MAVRQMVKDPASCAHQAAISDRLTRVPDVDLASAPDQVIADAADLYNAIRCRVTESARGPVRPVGDGQPTHRT